MHGAWCNISTSVAKAPAKRRHRRSDIRPENVILANDIHPENVIYISVIRHENVNCPCVSDDIFAIIRGRRG